jgi:hypothetical protein
MTAQINLGLVWASGGGTTPVGDVKYADGWVAEIPTYQNFNYMVQGLDQNILHLAEETSFDWQDDINYKAGARVNYNGVMMSCNQDNINIEPTVDDTIGAYWVLGVTLGALPSLLLNSDGVKIQVLNRITDVYSGNDVTVINRNPMIVLNTNGGEQNISFGNQAGEAVVSHLGTDGLKDGRDLTKGAGNTFRIFHEGHKPLVAEVIGAVDEAPVGGKLYARKGLTATTGEWLEVTSTTVGNEPPADATGAGRGWYSLTDGQFYLDIFDGLTSQWVPASPPQVMKPPADDVTYDDTLTSLGVDNVQDAIVALRALII